MTRESAAGVEPAWAALVIAHAPRRWIGSIVGNRTPAEAALERIRFPHRAPTAGFIRLGAERTCLMVAEALKIQVAYIMGPTATLRHHA